MPKWHCFAQGFFQQIGISVTLPAFSFLGSCSKPETRLHSHQGPTHVEDSEEEINDESTTAKAPRAAPPTQSKTGKQKKKKGKKGKGDPAEKAEPPPAAENEEDLDKILLELNIHLVSGSQPLFNPIRTDLSCPLCYGT
jgi:hypothetical protein